jgi:hypothetical protein
MRQAEVFKVLQRLQNASPLDPDPVNENSENFADWYVENLHGQPQDDVIERLKLQVLSSAGARHAYLFTGTIGSGKSTELRRLAFELKNAGQFAAVVNIADYLNPQEPIGLPDLLMAISLGTWEAAAKVMGVQPETGQRLAWWESLLQSRPEGKDLEISGGIVKLKFALQTNPTYRERMRKYFEASLDELVRETNTFLRTTAENIRVHLHLPPDAKCMLLVDSLEQFGGLASAGQDDQVLSSVIALFNHHSQQLRLDGWSVLYSVPPLLQKLAPGIAAIFPRTSYLTSAHVFLDRKDDIDRATVDQKLIPLLKKRLGAQAGELFADEVLRDMVVKSGGDLRNLMRIAADAVLEGLANQQFPVSQILLNKVYNVLRRPYLPLPQDAQQRLAHVREHKEPLLQTPADWPKVMSDLAAKRILLYLNGTEWYDVHPLLRDEVSAQQKLV